MASKEDEITNAIIQDTKKSPLQKLKKASPERHYDYYGNRGAVDLYLEYKQGQSLKARVIEVKANLQNANEVVRQCQKMAKYFLKDESNLNRKVEDGKYELIIYPTEENLEHIKKHIQIYDSLESVSKYFYHPDGTSYLPISYFIEDGEIKPKDFDIPDSTLRNAANIFFELGYTSELPDYKPIESENPNRKTVDRL